MGAVRVSERDVQRRATQQAEHQSYFPAIPIYETENSIMTLASAVPCSTTPTSVLPATPALLHVLVAEDDPVNSKIIHKRLTKLGHTVVLTSNGEACANAFTSASQNFDVVLMDLQMPIVDGMTATKMIREFESKTPDALSYKVQQNERIPVFAVSASLLESERQTYIDTGFDGWVMKPINFTRLNVLLGGLSNREARAATSYEPGQWENGGWFNA
jgi:CheY-like chemotaxis protein